MIRVLVVDDSPTVRARLVEILARDPDLQVVGEAADGRAAVALAASLRPDVITLDLALPEMNGLAVTETIMAHHPTPILIVSASFNRGELYDTYQALAAGAVDVLDKPRPDDDGWDARFVSTVRMVSKIKVITHPRGRLGSMGRSPTLAPPAPVAPEPIAPGRRPELIAIGASTGGPGALVSVISAIPEGVPIVVVLHIGDAFAVAFADWLGTSTGRRTQIARDGDPIDGAPLWFATPGRHLVVDGRRFRLTSDPPRHHCKPSIDVLFESIAGSLRDRATAVLLTGMGRDGAAGLLAIRQAGGLTIAQDEATSVVYGMPREAALLGAARYVLPLQDIGPALARLSGLVPEDAR